MTTKTKTKFTPTLESAVTIQADLNKRAASITKARGTRDNLEFVQYVVLIAYGNENNVKLKTKATKAVKVALEDAGRSERNTVTIVGACFNAKIRKLVKGIGSEEIMQHLADAELDSVSKLIRYNAKPIDPVAAMLERLAKFSDEQRVDFYAAVQVMMDADE